MSSLTPRPTHIAPRWGLLWIGGVALSFLAVVTMFLGVGEAALLGAVSAAAVVALRSVKQANAAGAPSGRAVIVNEMDRMLTDHPDHTAVVMSVQIDDLPNIQDRLDASDLGQLHEIIRDRLALCLGSRDRIGALTTCSFSIALAADRASDMESVLQLARRVQQALAEPISIRTERFLLSFSVGFCLSDRVSDRSGKGLVSASHAALREARRQGPGAVRSYSRMMEERIQARNQMAQEAATALKNGEITAYFQPQVSAQTGEITGFETLARWIHPDKGIIPPFEFLPVLEQRGMMPELGRVMVRDALAALQCWRDRGISIPRVGVNFSTDELRDPNFIEWVEMELDRFGLSAECLAIEVLETVVADKSDEVIIENLSGLARLGCCIDLDDFGTGHASITNIRRFSIERIKIDRSFVSGIDTDPEQQEMVATIIEMASRLGLDTLCEGVETEAERDIITGMGCGHLQGFGVARPMPLDQTDPWIATYNADRLGVTPLRRHSVGA